MTKRRGELAREYQGSRFRIVHCEGALESFREALTHIEARRALSLTQRLISQINRLANGEPLSREHFPKEGALPGRPGQQQPRYFHALKRIPIRGYCWQSQTKPDTYFISHYVYKDYDALADRDTRRVGNNWRRIEENGDDY